MEVFIDRFISKCKEIQQEPPRSIIDHCKLTTSRNGDATTLNLTGLSLTPKICQALGHAIRDDQQFSKIIIADAFLGDDGCIHIANALKTNTTVKSLDLRGNNIRADGASAVASMLKLNNTLKSISLEWNCIGIWETGAKNLGEAMTVNQTLEELDVRNNKIGPQGVASLATSLKHNTSLKRLDLRWNNAGIIGGRAMVDMLKWNMIITDVELTGNEIPEDVGKAIGISIERNRERSKQDSESRKNSQHLASTLQALTSSHADQMRNYSSKFQESESARSNLGVQLDKACNEIRELSAIKRELEKRIQEDAKEKAHLEENLKMQFHKVDALQRDICSVREDRIKSDDSHSKQNASINRKALELEAKLGETEMQLEVLRRDKKMLLEDLDRSKERERNTSALCEDKLKRQESSHQTKLAALESAKESELAEKIKKMEEKIRAIESEKIKAEENLENEKSRYTSKKRLLEDKNAEIEKKSRELEDTLQKEFKTQLDAMRNQRDALQTQLAHASSEHAKSMMELEKNLLSKLSESRAHQHKEIETLEGKISHFASNNSSLQQQLLDEKSRFEREKKVFEERIASFERDAASRMEKEVAIWKREVEKGQAEVHKRDNEITSLKEQNRKLNLEMDERDEDNVVKMKELQVAISTLISSRSARGRK